MQTPLDPKTSLPDATVVYLSKDPIQNLQVKISIRRVVLAELAETGSLNTNQTSESATQPDTAAPDRAVAFTEVFRWQQKKEDNPQSANEVFLFTRIDGESENTATPQPNGEPNGTNTNNANSNSGCFGGTAKPPPEEKLPVALTEDIYQTMHIMAGIKGPTGLRDIFTLCYIKAYTDGTLAVKPGFINPGVSRPYSLSTLDSVNYEYTIGNASEILQPHLQRAIEQYIDPNIYNSLMQKNTETPLRDPFGALSLKERNRMSVLVQGEIVDAYDFEYDNLYIEYFLELPAVGWSNDTKVTSAVTHISQARDSVTHFAFPFEFAFDANTNVTEWPRVLLQVNSYDNWDRRRVEGYGYFTIPPHAGLVYVTVATWVPETSIRSRMFDYFIGGAHQLHDIKYEAFPQGTDSNVVNKFGFATRSSGSVNIRVNNIIIGGSPSMYKSAQKGTVRTKGAEGTLVDDTSASSTLTAVMRAKQRLAQSRRLKKTS